MAFTIKQNDTSPSLKANLTDSDLTPIALTGATVKLHMKSITGVVKVDSSMIIIDAANGVIQYNWSSGNTDTVGTYYVEFQVTYSDGSIETFPNSGNKVISVVRELN
tara:strand:- start:183 stop:503 length:321 start_codon:yes stop_codon:yes gene_type:complete